MTLFSTRKQLFALLLSLALWPLAVVAQSDRPQTSPEGLELVSSSDAGAFYVRPGVTLSENTETRSSWRRIVAVDETWVRNYNRQALRSRRLRDKDLEEIKTRLANGFWDVFGGTFFSARAYQEVQDASPSKLILRPAILDVSLVSVNTSNETLVQNFGSDANGKMTLVLEIYDAKDSQLVGRLFNAQPIGDDPDFGLESEANNRADERKVFRDWAEEAVSLMQAN